MSDGSTVNCGESSSQNRDSPAIDAISPYYIHPSDSSSQVHVMDWLTERNYGEWVNDMSTILYAKNKFAFIDGTIARPAATSSTLPHWIHADAMVRGWLKTAMEKDVCSSVRSAKIVHAIWIDLAERFGKGSAPRVYELRCAIINLLQEKLLVSAYYTRLKSLWDEAADISPLPACSCFGCTCSLKKQIIEMQDKEHFYDFFMGLDDSFSTIKTQILSSQPIPSVGMAYHPVSEDEQQRNISAGRQSSIEAAAFQSRSQGSFCGWSQDVHKGYNDARSNANRPKCTYCGKMGHLEASCYEIIRFPADWRRTCSTNQDNRNPLPNNGCMRTSGNPRPPLRATHVQQEEQSTNELTQEQVNILLRQLVGKAEQDNPSTTHPDPCVNMAGKILCA